MREQRDVASVGEAGAPGWFVGALQRAPRHGDVEVAGEPVHHRGWSGPSGPDLLLVHGAAAHSGWWDHIAPQLPGSRVVALDLTGHGDSGHRDRYDMRGWVEEIVAVAGATGLQRPVLVGHSMGGRAALSTAIEHPALVRGVVCIDTPLDRGRRARADVPGSSPAPVFTTVDEAVARFRTRPRTDGVPGWLQQHVARGSVRPVPGGWTWKADQGVFGRGGSLRELLPRVAVPMVLLRGQRGLVSPVMAAEMAALAPDRLPVIDLPECGHHPMLEAPLTLTTALRSLLAVWPASSSGRAGPTGTGT